MKADEQGRVKAGGCGGGMCYLRIPDDTLKRYLSSLKIGMAMESRSRSK